MATVTINKARVIQTVEDAAERGLADSMFLLAQKQRLSMTRMGRFVSSIPGSPPNIQRAGLSNSIKSGQTGRMRWGAGSTMKGKSNYAYFMEKGATVRPKRTKFLPVPINPAATRLLEHVGKAGLRSATLKWRIFRTPRGVLLMEGLEKGYKPKGKDKRVQLKGFPVFKLARVVKIKPRPWCVVAFNKNKKEIKAAFDAAFAKHIRKHLGGKR